MRDANDQGSPVRWWILLTTALASMLAALDISVVIIAIPDIRASLSVTPEEAIWVSSIYLLAMLILTPLTAFLTSLVGRRRLYLGALVLFVLSSWACGLASSMPQLLVARFLQGVGAGVMSTSGPAMMRESFPAKQQAFALSIFIVTQGLGATMGPVLGGYLIEWLSWRWVFYINIPVGAAAIVLASRFIKNPPFIPKFTGRVDYLGIALLVLGFTCFQTVLERGERTGWFDNPENVVLTLVAGSALLYFIAHELEVRDPAVELRLFSVVSFTSVSFVFMMVSMVDMAGLFLLPMWVIEVMGYSRIDAALVLVPKIVTGLAVMLLAGRLYNIVTPRQLVGTGLVALAIGYWLMSTWTLETSVEQTVFPQALLGLGASAVTLPLMTLALQSVDKSQATAASGLFNVVRRIGSSSGLVIFIVILGSEWVAGREALVSHLAAHDSIVVARVEMYESFFRSAGFAQLDSETQAAMVLSDTVALHSRLIAFENVMAIAAVVHVLLVPLVFLIRKKS